MILIVDYGLGNLLSVSKAFEEVAGEKKVVISRNPLMLEEASHIVLPGVGNFKTGMENLQKFNFIGSLTQQVTKNKKPFLGICLGMQLLAEKGEEAGETPGLGWVRGKARRLMVNGLKLPHIGWDNLETDHQHPLFKNIGRDREFYFVHSYCVECPEEYIIGKCVYGEPFAAVICRGNIYATQFHPEKSREQGLKLLRNFLKLTC